MDDFDYSCFEHIYLLKSERSFLRKLRFHKKLKASDAPESLFKFGFIATNEPDGMIFGSIQPHGTVSTTELYDRYREYVRRYLIALLPNWIAIVISLISLIFSGISLYISLGLIPTR